MFILLHSCSKIKFPKRLLKPSSEKCFSQKTDFNKSIDVAFNAAFLKRHFATFDATYLKRNDAFKHGQILKREARVKESSLPPYCDRHKRCRFQIALVMLQKSRARTWIASSKTRTIHALFNSQYVTRSTANTKDAKKTCNVKRKKFARHLRYFIYSDVV